MCVLSTIFQSSSLPFHVLDCLAVFFLVILPIIFNSVCELRYLKTPNLPFISFKVYITSLLYFIDSRIKCWKLVIHDRSLSSPELSRYSRDAFDDRDEVCSVGSRFLLLTLCTDNLPLPQFVSLHFAVQMVLFFAQVQRMLQIQLVWFSFL